MDKSLRNTLRNVVTQCRRLLEEAVAELLEGQFGIYVSGKIDSASQMGHLSNDDLEYREQLLVHLQHIQAAGFKAKDAVEQLVREVAFTHLNRFCAYKMMETRGLIRKAVSDGLKSQGFLFYLADNSEEEKLYNEGKQDVAYRHFLEYLGSTLSSEIGVLFSTHDPANRLLPPQRVIDSVLNLINSEELKNIWVEDETIGWVYQYFTPKELRDKARQESQAPRNSYELAFRNQFYTPSYVVQFLTDNTLGRIWYEMQQGNTTLTEHCKYLVRRPNEVFLAAGEEIPAQDEQHEDLSQEELLKQPVYILHRPKKDPRNIKIIDPACGSGHFLLYCFSLLLTIYQEAYDDPDLSTALKQDYANREDYRKAVPGLILAYNLHGIDIDIRATQIAALALWLRAQRAYQDMEIKKNRPPITKSNIVCAEPMPGEKELLDEFVKDLQPTVLGQLVEVIFEKMKLAGEAGSLLKIEAEIKDVIAQAKQQWQAKPTPKQLFLLPEYEQRNLEELNFFNVSDITDEEFWNQAETLLVETLRDYANCALDGKNKLLRQLFVDDAVQGFSFLDICRKKFDVLLMNPPFGEPSIKCQGYIRDKYPDAADNLYAAFLIRIYSLMDINGLAGAITDRSYLTKQSFEDLRHSLIKSYQTLKFTVDLGWGVLDTANVETCATIISKKQGCSYFINIADSKENIESNLLYLCDNLDEWMVEFISTFSKFPFASFSYAMPDCLRESFRNPNNKIDNHFFRAVRGMAGANDQHLYRLVFEISPQEIGLEKRWIILQKGSPYSPYYFGTEYLLMHDSGKFTSVMSYSSGRVTSREEYGKSGLSFGKRTDYMYAFPMREGQVFSVEGQAIFSVNNSNIWQILAVVNSTPFQELVNHICGQHKYHGYINAVHLNTRLLPDCSNLSYSIWQMLSDMDSFNETACHFVLPLSIKQEYIKLPLKINIDSVINIRKDVQKNVQKLQSEINEKISQFLSNDFRFNGAITSADYVEVLYGQHDSISLEIYNLLSYIIGVIFGRWDIRIAKNPDLSPKILKPFEPLPICPPGTLISPDGLPATSENIVSEEWLKARLHANSLPPEDSVQKSTILNSEYPIPVKWDSILVDDPGHPDYLIRHVQNVLQVIWNDRSDVIEQEACEILGVEDLREYFRKSGNGGFWTDHIKRYSKGRRKAPIYWLLQSSKKNYGIWIYYHRLDKDTLFKALVNYVEPKIRLEESSLEQLRSQKEAAGTAGKLAKQLEKQIDIQESLISELHDFQDKLRRAANLNLEPDLNDGVVLNIAPLWELVPWSEAKKYWQELTAGKYEWSSIGKQLRAKGIIST